MFNSRMMQAVFDSIGSVLGKRFPVDQFESGGWRAPKDRLHIGDDQAYVNFFCQYPALRFFCVVTQGREDQPPIILMEGYHESRKVFHASDRLPFPEEENSFQSGIMANVKDGIDEFRKALRRDPSYVGESRSTKTPHQSVEDSMKTPNAERLINERVKRDPSAPVGDDGLEIMRRIRAESQYAEVNGIKVDLFSASGFVNVYDQLSPANQAKLLDLPVGKAIRTVFKLLK